MASCRIALVAALVALAGCTTADVLLPGSAATPSGRPLETASSGNAPLDRLISSYAASYQVPETLVRRVVKRESNFRPGARNGPYWGLMQIRHDTAKGMGYRGPASGLLDAETNLKYAVKYLRGAYIVAGGNHDQAVRFYSRGYYYDAKRKGLLVASGLRPGPAAKADTAIAAAPPAAAPAASVAFSGPSPSSSSPAPLTAAPMPMPAFKPLQ